MEVFGGGGGAPRDPVGRPVHVRGARLSPCSGPRRVETPPPWPRIEGSGKHWPLLGDHQELTGFPRKSSHGHLVMGPNGILINPQMAYAHLWQGDSPEPSSSSVLKEKAASFQVITFGRMPQKFKRLDLDETGRDLVEFKTVWVGCPIQLPTSPLGFPIATEKNQIV